MCSYREEIRTDIIKHKVCVLNARSAGPETMTALHWHEIYEILYVRSGYGQQRINADTLMFHPGDVVIICPEHVHSTDALAQNGCDIDVVQFTKDFFFDSENLLQKVHSGIFRPKDNSIQQLFDYLSQHRSEDVPGHDLVIAGLIHTLCGFLVRLCYPQKTPVQSSVIRNICMHLETRQDLRLERVAAHFNYSTEHLSRKFREETGETYRDWCDRLRMRRAVALLTDDRNSISDITEQLGYSDSSSFIRAFKRLYGITPNAYRHRCKTMEDESMGAI